MDFVAKSGRRVTAVEVKGGRVPQAHAVTAAFAQAFRPQRTLLAGGDDVAIGDFPMQPVEHWALRRRPASLPEPI